MHYYRLYLILLCFSGYFLNSTAYSQDSLSFCRKAFLFNSEEYAVVNTIMICRNADSIPTGYLANLDMPVCNDGLCTNLFLKIYWDLAGGYMGYDTIQGKPLTKFDHIRFTTGDYEKLHRILKDKNSILGTLGKEDLIDKQITRKASTVDAVSGATQRSIKNGVVEGAVYSSFELWHLVYSSLKDSIRAYTVNIYSEQVAKQLLFSDNYDSQLFAFKHMSDENFKAAFPLLFQVIRTSVPLIRVYIISKAPLPFIEKEQNKEFVSLFPELDSYSKSVFIDRITAEKNVATVFLPLMIPQLKSLDSKQLNRCISAFQKFEIDVPAAYR
jgi:hypothetical protein